MDDPVRLGLTNPHLSKQGHGTVRVRPRASQAERRLPLGAHGACLKEVYTPALAKERGSVRGKALEQWNPEMPLGSVLDMPGGMCQPKNQTFRVQHAQLKWARLADLGPVERIKSKTNTPSIICVHMSSPRAKGPVVTCHKATN